MSHFADYKLEREGKHVIENEHGFISYIIQGESCYIEDLFISLPSRRKFHGSDLADQVSKIALDKGCKHLLGSIVPTTFGATDSMKALFAYGFRLQSAKENFIWLSKEIA